MSTLSDHRAAAAKKEAEKKVEVKSTPKPLKKSK